MTKSNKDQPFDFSRYLPLSLGTELLVTGTHPLRIYYQDQHGADHTAVLWSSAALTASSRSACEAYVRALGGQMVDVHAEVLVF